MTFKEQCEQALGVQINNWDNSFASLSQSGKLTQRALQDLILIICKKIDGQEKTTII